MTSLFEGNTAEFRKMIFSHFLWFYQNNVGTFFRLIILMWKKVEIKENRIRKSFGGFKFEPRSVLIEDTSFLRCQRSLTFNRTSYMFGSLHTFSWLKCLDRMFFLNSNQISQTERTFSRFLQKYWKFKVRSNLINIIGDNEQTNSSRYSSFENVKSNFWTRNSLHRLCLFDGGKNKFLAKCCVFRFMAWFTNLCR